MKFLKFYLLRFLAILLGLLAVPIVLEVGLRFFPVFSGMPVNRSSQIYSFKPNVTIQRSADWDMKDARKRKVNNAGFISDQEYDASSQNPLIAIIGDSYIEAMQIDYQETVEANLLAKCSPKVRIYSFGAQFAPLSQYLSWADHVGQTYHPKMMVINIVGNDFDESLLSIQKEINNGGTPGMQYFDLSVDPPRLVTIPFKKESWIVKILRHSVLAQYLVRNVGIVNLFKINSKPTAQSSLITEDLMGDAPKDVGSQGNSQGKKFLPASRIASEYVGNTNRFYSREKLELTKKAVDIFLNNLPAAARLPANSIVLSVDAERPLIYTSDGQKDEFSFFSIMRKYLIEKAKSQGFLVIDLRPKMIAEYSLSGRRYEFPNDNHWNSYGHQLLANELYLVPKLRKICDE